VVNDRDRDRIDRVLAWVNGSRGRRGRNATKRKQLREALDRFGPAIWTTLVGIVIALISR
jgi:hypothetical protein